MPYMYARICKHLNVNNNLYENYNTSIKLEILTVSTMTSQNDDMWVLIHAKSGEVMLREKKVHIIN